MITADLKEVFNIKNLSYSAIFPFNILLLYKLQSLFFLKKTKKKNKEGRLLPLKRVCSTYDRRHVTESFVHVKVHKTRMWVIYIQ